MSHGIVRNQTWRPRTSRIWQQSCHSRLERFAHLYKTRTLADVVFIVGKEKTRIEAHQLVLMMSSQAFEQLFDSGLTQFSSRSKKKEVEVPEVEASIFEAALQFIYLEEFKIQKDDTDSLLSLLLLSKKYQLETLANRCLLLLIYGLNKSNVLKIFDWACLKEITELKGFTLEIICRNASSIFSSSEALKMLCPKQMERLCESDDLNMDEIDLFAFVLSWALESCRMLNMSPRKKDCRAMLEHILPQIRFGLMSAAEISKFVVPVKLISSDELVRLYVAKTSEAQPNAPGPDVTLASVSSSQNSYIDRKQFRPRNRFAIFTRFTGKATLDRSDLSGVTQGCVSFKVDRQVRIYGISIFGREPLVLAGRLLKPRGTLVFKYGVRLLNEDLKILVDQQGWPKIVGENVFVKFDKPCKILPNKMYTLVSTVKGIGTIVIGTGAVSLVKVPWKGETVTFEFFKTPDALAKKKACEGAAILGDEEFPEFAFTF